MLQLQSAREHLKAVAAAQGMDLPQALLDKDLPGSWARLATAVLRLAAERLISPTFTRTLLELPNEQLLDAVITKYQEEVRALEPRLRRISSSSPNLLGEVTAIRSIQYLDDRIVAAQELESRALNNLR